MIKVGARSNLPALAHLVSLGLYQHFCADAGSLPTPPAPELKKSGGSGGIDDDLAARFEALKKGL